MHRYTGMKGLLAMTLAIACAGSAARRSEIGRERAGGGVRPGITVLLEDSLKLIEGKRIGLLTNQTGIDEHGVSDVDLLYRLAATGRDGGRHAAQLVALLSPEHGIRGTEDRTDLADGRDERTGLPVFSLYGATTLGP